MKFYIDLASRRFVKGPASSIPLERLFLKRRDKIDVEVIFVEKSAIVATPSGTSFSTGLKTAFSDTAFLALSDADGLLDLYTTALEALFADDPASVSAYLEVKTSRPGEETRTSTLAVDIENSVILGDEGSPAAEVSLKATSADAISGVSNEKWMTPLRVSEAIAALGGGSGGTAVNWTTLTGKPASFPPSSHTHPISEVSGLDSALATKITGSGVADMQVVTALPSSPSPTTFYIVIPTGAAVASAVTLGSVSLLTSSGGGGGTTFTPTSISGLQLWLDASDATSLFDATSGGSVVTADGAAVARWQDKSSNAYEAIQATANQRPILKQSVQNSKSILRFDGANDCLQIPSIELNTNITMFVVGKFFSTNPLWLEHDYGFYLSGASLGWLFRRLASVQAAGLPENWFAVSAAISSITYNGIAAQVRKNGTLLTNSAISGTAPTNLLYSAPLNIGSRGQTQLFSKGDFCEYLIYDGILSDQNRAQVESYLSTKWGIAL